MTEFPKTNSFYIFPSDVANFHVNPSFLPPLFVSAAMPPSPLHPLWRFPVKCDLHVTMERQQGCPPPPAHNNHHHHHHHHSHCQNSLSPLPPKPTLLHPTSTPHAPLRQQRGKGHPEERAPPRRPQWQFHIMPCPTDAASSKGYTLWDVTGPLYRAGGTGSIFFFSFLGGLGRRRRRGGMPQSCQRPPQ